MRELMPLWSWGLLVVLLAVVGATTLGVLAPDLRGMYIMEFVAPRLERELGFTLDERGIATIERGGVFHRAGFEVGDRPAGFVHGIYGFYDALQHVRNRDVSIRVLRGDRSVQLVIPATIKSPFT